MRRQRDAEKHIPSTQSGGSVWVSDGENVGETIQINSEGLLQTSEEWSDDRVKSEREVCGGESSES